MIRRLALLSIVGLTLPATPAMAGSLHNELTLEYIGNGSWHLPGYGARLELALGDGPLSVGALYQTAGELGKSSYDDESISAWGAFLLRNDGTVRMKLLAGMNHFVPMGQPAPAQVSGSTNAPSALLGPFVGLSLEGRWHMLWGELSPTYTFVSGLPPQVPAWLSSGLPLAQVGISLWDRVDLGVQLAMVPFMARLRF